MKLLTYSRLKSSLGTISNIASLAAALMAISVIVQIRHQVQAPEAIANSDSSYTLLDRGSVIKTDNLSVPAGHRILIMGLGIGCRYCEASAPFYRSMLTRLRKHDSNLVTVAVLPSSIEDSEAYLRVLGIRPDRVISGSLSDYLITGTPTLVLSDSDGKVRKAWIGQLTSAGQQSVLTELFGS